MSKICILCGCEYDDNQPSCPYCKDELNTKQKKKNKQNFNFNGKKILVLGIIFLIIIAISLFIFSLLNVRADIKIQKEKLDDLEEKRDYSLIEASELKNTLSSYDTQYKCPDFRGMTISEIEEHEYFTNDIINFEYQYIYNEEYPSGQVCGQSPAHNTTVEKDSTIYLYISE